MPREGCPVLYWLPCAQQARTTPRQNLGGATERSILMSRKFCDDLPNQIAEGGPTRTKMISGQT